MLAFMVIASQHPIVSWLSGRSNLGAEVVTFCTPADQAIVISSLLFIIFYYYSFIEFCMETSKCLILQMSLSRKR